MTSSLFITFEGPEGAGKTTQIELLKADLVTLGREVLVTRQPGGDPIGAELRKILLDTNRERVSPRTELLLMMADRSQSVETIIKPHLSHGGVVICDRYIDSSVAYQGGGRNIDIAWIDSLNSFATSNLLPDITFLLDIEPQLGLKRQKDGNRMELEDLAFHSRVRVAYLELARKSPNRIVIVDAEGSIESVQDKIKDIIVERDLLC
jgi:dTMP kinase